MHIHPDFENERWDEPPARTTSAWKPMGWKRPEGGCLNVAEFLFDIQGQILYAPLIKKRVLIKYSSQFGSKASVKSDLSSFIQIMTAN